MATYPKLEIININDTNDEVLDDNTVPSEGDIIKEVIRLWKEDPFTESIGLSKLHGILKQEHKNWVLSEKRLKLLLRANGLLANDASSSALTYSNDISFSEPPNDIDLPKCVEIKMISGKGKGVFAKTDIEEGQLLWKESPLFYTPSLDKAKLICNGDSCAHCGTVLQRSGPSTSLMKGLDCSICSEAWCSQICKKLDSDSHPLLKHNLSNSSRRGPISAEGFLKLQEFCFKRQWNGLYATAIIYATILSDKSGKKKRHFDDLAHVSQEVRHRLINSSAGTFDIIQGGALISIEKQRELWMEGFTLFKACFPGSCDLDKVDYSTFLDLLGTFSINNLDSSIYLIESIINHDCNPNLRIEVTTEHTKTLKAYATRLIHKGEELTVSYVQQSHPIQQRRRELRANWGFLCECDKCLNDLKFEHRRQSSSSFSKSTAINIRSMLTDLKSELATDELVLDHPSEELGSGRRRKSVRFDARVLSRSN